MYTFCRMISVVCQKVSYTLHLCAVTFPATCVVQNLDAKGSSLVLSTTNSRATTRLRNSHRSRTEMSHHIL